MFSSRLAIALLVVTAAPTVSSLAGCKRPGAPAEAAPRPPTAEATSSAEVQVVAGAGRRLDLEKGAAVAAVVGGRFQAGSVPGDDGRDPTVEPILASYDLPAFGIDALPYPGKPGVPPLTGVSQVEAHKLCIERGARLCTELEWERACRGPNGDPFMTGPAWDPTCSKTPETCVSGFGARSMGAAMEEWTASTVSSTNAEGKAIKRIAVKGAWASAAPSGHRCAARHAMDGSAAGGRPIGFRCCTGPAPNVSIAPIESSPTFRRATVFGMGDGAKLGELLASAPELARIAPARVGAPRFFKDTEASEVTDKAKSPPGASITITTEPILWSPEAGAELLVVTGKSRGGAFVVAFHVLPNDKYRLASSMIFANEQGPIVLAYQGNLRREILWSMSWGAAGEGGAVSYRDDHRVVIVQR